jgi:hypothetical protein
MGRVNRLQRKSLCFTVNLLLYFDVLRNITDIQLFMNIIPNLIILKYLTTSQIHITHTTATNSENFTVVHRNL